MLNLDDIIESEDVEEALVLAKYNIRAITHAAIKQEKPFLVMQTIAYLGQKYYEVPYNDSFWQGVNLSLDLYNSNPVYNRIVPCLVAGCEETIRHIAYNTLVTYKEVE